MSLSKLTKPKKSKNLSFMGFLYFSQFCNLQSLAEKFVKQKIRQILVIFGLGNFETDISLSSLIFVFYD